MNSLRLSDVVSQRPLDKEIEGEGDKREKEGTGERMWWRELGASSKGGRDATGEEDDVESARRQTTVAVGGW
ncbi:hypothetical protein NL676_007474 [Syzygium grande]|nr:hypothetical protein NL676_007474 [Syzygium grande]